MISRDELLDQILTGFKQNFGYAVDFNSVTLERWLVETLAILDENQLLYLSLLMNESFISTALFPSTVKKYAIDFGYAYQSVIPASGDIDLYIVVGNENIDTEIDYDCQFTYGDIVFIPTMKYYISYSYFTSTINVTAYDINGNKFIIPATKEIINDQGQVYDAIHIRVPVIQSERNVVTFNVTSSDIENYKFPTFKIPEQDKEISNINVYVSSYPAIRKNYIFEFTKDYYCYVLLETGNTYQLVFGNSLIGKGLKVGDFITAELLYSLGSKGNVYSNSLTLANRLVNKLTNQPLRVIIKHSDILNGEDAEDINEIRNKTIINLHINNRLVSRRDYENISKLINLPFEATKCVFTQSDLNVNEVDVFGYLTIDDLTVQTNTMKLVCQNDTIKQLTTLYQNDLDTDELSLVKTNPNAKEWVIPFEIKVNTDTMFPLVYFYPLSLGLDSRVIKENFYQLDRESYIKISDTYVVFDKDLKKSKFVINLNLNVGEFDENNLNDYIRLNIICNQNGSTYTYDTIYNHIYDSITKSLKLEVVIDDDLSEDPIDTLIEIYYKYADQSDFDKINVTSVNPFTIKINITELTPVKLSWNQINSSTIEYTFYGIPVFIYDERCLEDITNLFAFGVPRTLDYKMITTKVSYSFAKTVGLINNIKYSTSRINTAVENMLTIPLKLYIKAYCNSDKSIVDIQNEIKQCVKEFIGRNFETSVIRSKLIHHIHNSLDYIDDLFVYFVDKNGNLQEWDLVYEYTDYDVPKEDILNYKPEVIYTTDDDINVDVSII